MTTQNQIGVNMVRFANAIVIAGGVAAVLVFAHVFYRFGWTGERQFTSATAAVVGYGLPAGAALLLFAALSLKPAAKLNLALCCVSLAVSAYGGELFLRLPHVAPEGPKRPLMFLVSDLGAGAAAQLAAQFGVEVDPRTWPEVRADLRRQGVDAVPFISPPNNLFIRQPDGAITSAVTIHGEEVIPLGAISKQVTILCNENGPWVTYPSDEHGFNNPHGVWRAPHVAIAALGDSFTQGYCVPTEQSFVGRIRQRVPATLNLGFAGDGPLLMLATLEEYLPPLKPPLVLWFYFEGNDLTDLQTERHSRLLMRYLHDDFTQGLPARQGEIDRALTQEIATQQALERERRERRLANPRRLVPQVVGFLKLSALRSRLPLVQGVQAEDLARVAEIEGPAIALLQDILAQAQARVSGWGGTLYFVYLPSWSRYFDTPEIGVIQRPRVLHLVGSLGIPLIDLDPVFRAQPDRRALFPFRDTGHYNETGHRLVAEEVLNVLSAKEPDDAHARPSMTGPTKASGHRTGEP